MTGYFANILPEGKAALVERLQKEGRRVCFIGDGRSTNAEAIEKKLVPLLTSTTEHGHIVKRRARYVANFAVEQKTNSSKMERSSLTPMQNKSDLEQTIDGWNKEFTSNARKPLEDLSQYSTESLEWLMMEHYQFSFRNCEFLWNAAETAGAFDTDAVKKELTRNYKEESGHAAMYKAALKKVGSDVETRMAFAPTTHFLESLGKLCLGEPSTVLGTMFATETAAIFEHQVFKHVSQEVIARRGAEVAGKPLVYFHQMHLDGVEQSHKDELGIFLRGVYADQPVVSKEGDRPTIYPQQVLDGGKQGVELMKTWWAGLFAELNAQNGILAKAA